MFAAWWMTAMPLASGLIMVPGKHGGVELVESLLPDRSIRQSGPGPHCSGWEGDRLVPVFAITEGAIIPELSTKARVI